MNKIRKIVIRHSAGIGNTEVLIFRHNSSNEYGTFTPLTYATQYRIECLIESGKLGTPLIILTKVSLVIQFKISD